MKQSLRPGMTNVKRFSVDRDRTISFMGEEGRVYATPSLVRDMEHTCRDLLMEHADDGEDSVGVEITVRHLAATLPDMEVEITATVKAVDGRRVTFELEAKDEIEQIGAGSHTRLSSTSPRPSSASRRKPGNALPNPDSVGSSLPKTARAGERPISRRKMPPSYCTNGGTWHML